ncbi:hypothetical protein BDP27DRAFT_1330197 [Rhodocollybia butyracea]|uniref:Protein kinase domain-containing protein n=1 Tax=Rhodocollybia butyracea TaxID=206335 RepID=A0A9P5PJ67_9AGAR|nr:hypothetical protein BDP27DRAFT_1330197 [Rhodocollybia butyracea]
MIHEAVSSLSAGTPNMLDTALETINVDSTITVTGMTALLERHETGMIQLKDQELKFLRAGIARLTEQRSAEQVQIKSWTVTGLEVERGFLLGPDQASFIRAGRWLGKSVGIIEMKDVDTTLRFVKAWKNLRSHRIQGFVGASTVDNPPFILVQPSHLSISEYVTVTDRPIIRRLTYELVRALEYLHTRVPPVIHGGLRPANIDINSGNVLIGSIGLGLGHLRIPEHQRLALEPSLRQWTAPELLENPEMSPNTQTDIFSLGKIITELINIIHKRRPSANFPVLSSIAEKCTTQFTEQSPHYQISDLFAPLPSASGPNTAELTGLLKINQWRVTPYTCTTPAIFKEEDHRYYVASAPLQGIHEHPLRQLCIEVNCHDQGENPCLFFA